MVLFKIGLQMHRQAQRTTSAAQLTKQKKTKTQACKISCTIPEAIGLFGEQFSQVDQYSRLTSFP